MFKATNCVKYVLKNTVLTISSIAIKYISRDPKNVKVYF